MFHHLSRLLYRELAPLLRDDPRQGGIQRQRQRLLDACEATTKRLVTDPEYFADPARYLFSEVRTLFGISEQLRVRRIVDLEIALAQAVIERQRRFIRRECAAYTRSGDRCRREPPAEGRYCPSHRHLGRAAAGGLEVAA